MCAKLTLEISKFDSTTEVLAELHWLPIRQRINFKIATKLTNASMGLYLNI